MIAVSALLILAALAVIPLFRRGTGDWLSPAAIVLSTWFGCLGLYLLMLLPYKPLDAESLGLLAAGLAFLAGGIGVGTALGRRMARSMTAPDAAAYSSRTASTWVEVFSLAGICGFLWYVRGVVHLLGWKAFRSGTPIRWALAVKRIPSEYLFLELFCVIAPLLASAFLLSGVRLRRHTIAGAIVCLATLWLTTDRTQFFTVILTITFMIFLRYGRRLSFASAVGVVAAAGVVLVLNFWIVGAWLGKTPENLGVKLEAPRRVTAPSPLASEVLPDSSPAEVAKAMERPAEPGTRQLPRALQKFSTLYLYATGSFAAFSVLTDLQPEWTAGAHTLYPIARAFDRAGLWPGRLPAPIPPYRVITRGPAKLQYNAYTYLYYPYNDFGAAGVVVVSLLTGIACGAAYGVLLVRRESPIVLLLTAQACFALVLSVFVNKFNNTASWYVAFFAALPFLGASLGRLRRARAGP